MEYAYHPGNRDADVLIFGDSSAFIGVDPRTLNGELGIRSLVLPDTLGSIPVTGMDPLDMYLSQHAPPRVLVFYFAVWNLDFSRLSQRGTLEGEEMMLRHGRRREIMQFTLRHPIQMLELPLQTYASFGPQRLSAFLHHTNREGEVAEGLGHVALSGVPALQTPCAIPANLASRPELELVQSLVTRYQTPRTQVLIYLAPVPDCMGAAALAERSYAKVKAAPPAIFPAHCFVNDSGYAHILAPYVQLATEALARALKSRLPLTGVR